MTLEQDIKTRQKKVFLDAAANEFKPKSFYDKHIKTIPFAANFSKFIFSPISIAFGVIAVYSIALNSVGLKLTLIESLTGNGYLPYLLIAFSIAFLGFIELGKHHFYSEGFTEYFRKTDDFGSREFRFAISLQLISVAFSFFGGYLAANEISGTEKTKVLESINSEYKPKLDEISAKIKNYESDDFKNANGKTLYKVIPILQDLEAQKATIETSYKAAKENENVSDGFVAANEIGTNKMIWILGGSQILIEVFLTFSIWWVVFFKSKSVYELGITESDIVSIDKNIKLSPSYPTQNLAPVMNEANKRPIGFNNTRHNNTDTKELTHNTDGTKTQHKVKNEVSQAAQQNTAHLTITNIDLSDEKKRVRLYTPRIFEKYTEKRLETLKKDVKKLAKFGYSVTIEKDKKANIRKNIELESGVVVNFGHNGLTIKYEK